MVVCGHVQELQGLKQEKKELQQKCEQQEQALQEMGLHLSQLVLMFLLLKFFFINTINSIFTFLRCSHLSQRSKLKMEDFKEVNKALKVRS